MRFIRSMEKRFVALLANNRPKVPDIENKVATPPPQANVNTQEVRMLEVLQALSVRLRSILNNDEGATMVEYSLILALITVLSITLIGSIGKSVSTAFSNVNTKF